LRMDNPQYQRLRESVWRKEPNLEERARLEQSLSQQLQCELLHAFAGVGHQPNRGARGRRRLPQSTAPWPSRRPFGKTFSPPQSIRQAGLYFWPATFRPARDCLCFRGASMVPVFPARHFNWCYSHRPPAARCSFFGFHTRRIDLKRQRGEIIGRPTDE